MNMSEKYNANIQIDLDGFTKYEREVIEFMIKKCALGSRQIKRRLITGKSGRKGYVGRLGAINELEKLGVLERFERGTRNNYTLHLEELRKIV